MARFNSDPLHWSLAVPTNPNTTAEPGEKAGNQNKAACPEPSPGGPGDSWAGGRIGQKKGLGIGDWGLDWRIYT